MKKIVILLLFVSIGCSYESDDDYKLLDIKYLEYKDLFNSLPRLSGPDIKAEKGLIINDEIAYRMYADSICFSSINVSSDSIRLEKIDFNKYTLLGILTGYGACDSINRSVGVNYRDKKLYYSVDIDESDNMCNKMLIISFNFVLVSKIPDNYKIDFYVSRF